MGSRNQNAPGEAQAPEQGAEGLTELAGGRARELAPAAVARPRAFDLFPGFPFDRCEACFKKITGMGVLCGTCESKCCNECGRLACVCPSDDADACDFCDEPTGVLGKCLPCESAVRAEVEHGGSISDHDSVEVTEQRIENLRGHAGWLRDITLAFPLNESQSDALKTGYQLCCEKISQLEQELTEYLADTAPELTDWESVRQRAERPSLADLTRAHIEAHRDAWRQSTGALTLSLLREPTPSGYAQIENEIKSESARVLELLEGPGKK